jgi:aspartyl-tRNA(Asn)/glutamyl-tRNA(Gln) amidotransferase subunit C
MALTLEQVRHVAELAALSLSPEEERQYQGQLSAILAAVDTLRDLPAGDVSPMSHATQAPATLRADVAQPSLDLEKGLANAPARGEGSFAVPKILE